MTPAARYAAAIEVLDAILAGGTAEPALKQWGRSHRFAGSKDRAAIRDHVFDVLRAKRSLAPEGADGRALIIGLLQREGIALETVFGADAYAPAAISAQEAGTTLGCVNLSQAAACDVPEWLWPIWNRSLGDDAVAAAKAQQQRAPIFVRLNLKRTNRGDAIAALAEDGIVAIPHDTVGTALQVIENERRLKTSRAYTSGLVELQDASSQAAMHDLDMPKGARVLDYCAGGGGKALALADIFDAQVTAHDIALQRMVDLPIRAMRAGVRIAQAETGMLGGLAPFDVVLCDAPCSGSGTWRRTPEAKWALSVEKMHYYNDMQRKVLRSAVRYVAPGGTLAYATCSVLDCENQDIVNDFLNAHPGWRVDKALRLLPGDAGDGFFLTTLVNPV